MEFVNADCDRIAIENPIGYMNTHYRKADQIIHPYMFGDPVRKATCLWLKNVPALIPTNVVEPNLVRTDVHLASGKVKSSTFSGPAYFALDENGKKLSWSDPRTAKERSKTYPGIADAIADQWGNIAGYITPVQLSLF